LKFQICSGELIKIKDIRAMQDDLLASTRDQLVLELNVEKSKTASTGVQSKIVKIREIRRTIARINTMLRERGAKS
jgi:ribosomal protein L29